VKELLAVLRERHGLDRDTVAAMARGGVVPPAGAPAEAFIALRSRTWAASGLAGDLFAMHVGLGIELRFVPASP